MELLSRVEMRGSRSTKGNLQARRARAVPRPSTKRLGSTKERAKVACVIKLVRGSKCGQMSESYGKHTCDVIAYRQWSGE